MQPIPQLILKQTVGAPVKENCMHMRQYASSKLGLNDFIDVCGSIQRLPKPQKVEKIEWLSQNISSFEPKIFKSQYGLLLNLLKRAAPVKPMVELLILITDASMITQSRIAIICDIYIRKNHSPSIQKLLRALGKICPPHIYIPPLGQRSSENASIPIRTALIFADRPSHGNSGSAELSMPYIKCCTDIYYRLSLAMPDVELAKELASIFPLIEQSGKVPLAVERRIYEYLEETWLVRYSGNYTAVLYILATRLFRYWPPNRAEILKKRMLEQLKLAQRAAAEIILPHLWELGPIAEPLVAHLAEKIRPRTNLEWNAKKSDRAYLHIFLYYMMNELTPPASVVRDLIIHKNVYLFMCSDWAHLVPDICASLQGEFHLVSPGSTAFQLLDLILGQGVQNKLNTIFNLNNSPWLGGYPQQVFSRVKALGNVDRHNSTMTALKRPVRAIDLLDADTVTRDAGVPYPEFYRLLVWNLELSNLHILPYLQSSFTEETADMKQDVN